MAHGHHPVVRMTDGDDGQNIILANVGGLAGRVGRTIVCGCVFAPRYDDSKERSVDDVVVYVSKKE